MYIQILMQRLRVLHVAREGIEAIEPASGGIVEPGAEVLLLDVAVEMFAAVKQAG